jgi:hypothetical protein
MIIRLSYFAHIFEFMKTKLSTVFLFVSLILTTAPSSFAQTAPNDWSAVQKLAAGTDLFIKLANGKIFNGSLITANDNEIHLSVKGNRSALSKNNIETIYLAVPKSKKTGKIIGAVTGFLVGAAAGGAVNRNAVYESDYNYSAAVLLTVASGVGGYFIGGLFGKGKKRGALIYKAK